ncbi:MAG: O-antigen ligase family protein, partial [Planctomycetes bacterium]|nr:O-antigen ligase family protein [Planctomycetota bacterium]
MARGATVRFRLYTWQYAADLWSRRPISGVGAAAFPRLSGQMAIRDKALDPAAFMGDWTAHAHNELFEVFSEIGMLGGVTFVGGFVATIIAALRLLRKPLSSRERWLYAGVLAATAALMTDLMFSVGLRLPGVPAVFFTLIGITWAACRCCEAQPLAQAAPPNQPPAPGRPRRLLVAAVAGTCSIATGWLALRDWSGVRHEFAAYTALREQRYDQAIASATLAQTKLLDPVRRLFAGEREVRARYGRARTAFEEYRAAGGESGSATEAARRHAVTACRDTVDAAARLERRAPTFLGMPAIGARAAEMLVELHRGVDPENAAKWRRLAEQAWRLQRVYTPFDEPTLLALTRYPADLRRQIGLLRDALRAETTSEQWDTTLERVAAAPGFADTLTQFLVATGPFDPQTDLDALIASMAPEIHRLVAAYAAMNGALLDAADHSARAARLYEPMRGRFPMLQPAAIAEQAQYVFRASPSSPAEAIDLIRAAIEALPEIQEQQLAARARPFQVRLTTYLLAAGDEQAAREQLAHLLDANTDPSAV